MAMPTSRTRELLARDDVHLMSEAEALSLRERVERILISIEKRKQERKKRERDS